jgi:hypothetical protein
VRETIQQSDLRLANAEIARLRRRLGVSGRTAKRVERAYRDALLLANLHIGYLPTTRAAALHYAGITANRWENATALLKMARVTAGRVWLTHDLAEIESLLSLAAKQAIADPEIYRARLPKHARPKAER